MAAGRNCRKNFFKQIPTTIYTTNTSKDTTLKPGRALLQSTPLHPSLDPMQAIESNPSFQALRGVTIVQGPSASRESECSICMLVLGSDDFLLKHDACGACWHLQCLLTWLDDHCKCPWCRGCTKGHRETFGGAVHETAGWAFEEEVRENDDGGLHDNFEGEAGYEGNPNRSVHTHVSNGPVIIDHQANDRQAFDSQQDPNNTTQPAHRNDIGPYGVTTKSQSRGSTSQNSTSINILARINDLREVNRNALSAEFVFDHIYRESLPSSPTITNENGFLRDWAQWWRQHPPSVLETYTEARQQFLTTYRTLVESVLESHRNLGTWIRWTLRMRIQWALGRADHPFLFAPPADQSTPTFRTLHADLVEAQTRCQDRLECAEASMGFRLLEARIDIVSGWGWGWSDDGRRELPPNPLDY